MSTLLERAQALAPELISIRRDIHQHPEVGFAEHRTSQLVFNYLQELSLKPQIVAGTGVVATLRGTSPGRTIALRADMDALTITEQAEHTYTSKTPGLMHACGHDGHTAILLGVAKLLSEVKDLPGNVKFIFQPAEEGPGGALPMIEAGVLGNPQVHAMLGLHVGTVQYTAGQIALRYGSVCAAPDNIEIVVKGKGGHGGHPHGAIDAIVTAGHLIVALQSIVSREIDPAAAVVLSLGTVRGGYRENVIADEVTLTGTVRTLSPEIRSSMPDRIERIVKGVCDSFRCHYSFTYTQGYPALYNDEVMTALTEEVAQEVLGSANVFRAPHPTMGGEDFSYFAEKVPACFFMLGATNSAKQCDYVIHHPKFNFDEDAIPVGMALLAETAYAYLMRSGK
ncbi:MAG: putative hydrolase YxeP [Firmicutes bacterium]|nr:putative hydrolase YxeP [candidate division NPL-UPA2 bacterium]